MASKYIEEWLTKGLSLPKFLLRAIGAVGVAVSFIALIKFLRGVPYGADIALGLFFVALWAVSEMVRVKVVHKRYVRANPASPMASGPEPGIKIAAREFDNPGLVTSTGSVDILSDNFHNPGTVNSGPPISRTPQELWKLIEGLTELQASAVLGPFMEQPMVVSGQLDFVGSLKFPAHSPPFIQVTIVDRPAHISMFFRGEHWAKRLSMLSKGDTITVRGLITDVRPNALVLDDCEFA